MTGNLASPQTHLIMNQKLVTIHRTHFNTKLFPGGKVTDFHWKFHFQMQHVFHLNVWGLNHDTLHETDNLLQHVSHCNPIVTNHVTQL